MNQLQETFDKHFAEHFTVAEVVKRAIVVKLEQAGLNVDSQVKAEILEAVKGHLEEGLLSIEFDDKNLLRLNPEFSEEMLAKVDLDIRENEYDDILENITEKLSEIIPNLVHEAATALYKSLKRNRKSDLIYTRKRRAGFEGRLQRTWRSAIDSFEMFIELCIEAGSTINSSERPQAVKDKDLVFEALIRLHARATRVASEVLTLIKSGFADGANARWRTIHEINIVAMFIGDHGNDVANRYLLHEAIESLKGAGQINEFHAALGHNRIPARKIRALEKRADRLKQKFGKEFGGTYGWAATALNNPNPTFRDIEEAAGLDHWRPYYKLASHSVHAGPKGVFFSLGLINDKDTTLLAGPSDTGFADPAHGTALSLLQLTTQLLTRNPTIDSLTMAESLKKHADEVGEKFLTTQLRYEKKYKI